MEPRHALADPGPNGGSGEGASAKLYWLDEGELVPESMREAREEGRPWLEEADDWIARRRQRIHAEEEREEKEDGPAPMDGSSWL